MQTVIHVDPKTIEAHFPEFAPEQMVPIATNLPKAGDGSLLILMRDSEGQITGMVGTDVAGVVHQMDIERKSGLTGTGSGRLRFVTAITKYFENGQPYFYLSATLTSNGEEIIEAKAVAWTEGFQKIATYQVAFFDQQGKVFGRTPDRGNFAKAYPFPVADTPLPPYPGTAVAFPVAPAFQLEQIFPEELKRTAYFDPLLLLIHDEATADARAELLAQGVSIGALSGARFLKLSAPPAPPVSGAVSVSRQALTAREIAILKALGWGVGGALATWASGGTALAILAAFEGGYGASIVDSLLGAIPVDGPSGSAPASGNAGAPSSGSQSSGNPGNASQTIDEKKAKAETTTTKK